MKIYTKTGDDGFTSLTSGERVSKNSLRTDAYGTVDELNSFVGLLRAKMGQNTSIDAALDKMLQKIQNELFVVGSHLSTRGTSPHIKLPAFDTQFVSYLESEIDKMSSQLKPLKNFILPGGSERSALAHVLRTVTRRAERIAVSLAEEEQTDLTWVVFLNRLSDYFFVLGRYFNHLEKLEDEIWKPKG